MESFGFLSQGVPRESVWKRLLRYRRYWALLMLLLLPFSRFYGCAATDADKDQALQLETALHKQMIHGDIDAIYDNSDERFQSIVTRSHHDRYFAAIAEKFGYPRDCEPSDTAVKNWLGSRIIRSKCTTRFSNGYVGIETFEWKKTDDGYRLHGYSIKAQ
jgi:hypothetical protein